MANIPGTTGNDTLTGGTRADSITGDTGNDTIYGGGGNDTIYGGDGNDTIDGGTENDYIDGGNNNDSIDGGAGNDTLLGGSGDDRFVLSAGFGTDSITGGETGEVLGDRIDASGLSIGVTVGFTGSEAGSVFDGTNRATFTQVEAFTLTAQADTLDASNAALAVNADGGAGNDALTGGTGADTLMGGLGADTITAGAGNDLVYDEFAGNTAAGGADRVFLGAGDDTFVGSGAGNADNDLIYGGDGNDVITTAAGMDTVYGGAGNDTITLGNDTLATNGDVAYGEAGNDTIIGGNTNDTLDGGAGADSLSGNAGQDVLYGGTGAPIGTTFIQNGTFDAGSANWSGTDLETNYTEGSYLPGGSTNRVAEMDGYAGQTTVMQQSFDVSGAQSAQLTFRSVLRTDATLGTDGFRVDVLNAAGTVIGTMDVLPISKTAWANYSLNFNFPAAGTYTLRFTEVGNNDSLGAIVDDIQITATTAVADGSADTLSGGDGNDTLYGLAGNDSLIGDAGNDVLYGGDDNDLLSGAADNDTLYGDAGNDTVAGDAGNDLLYGGDGNDSVSGGADSDTVYGDAGDDTLTGDAGADSLFGGTGNDQLYGGTENDTLAGDAGNDLLYGGDGNDSVSGGADSDTVYGDAGDDSLTGDAGADSLFGGTGNDQLYGGTENDTLAGDAGNDLLYGGDGNDSVSGGADSDTLYGDAGDDTLAGDAGNDLLYGGDGNDALTGGIGADALYGGEGNDVLYGGDGDTVLSGGIGDDTIYAGADNSVFDVEDGRDLIYGGDGNDTFVGGIGDTVDGGAGFQDTLDLSAWGWANTNIFYNPADPQSGTVEFLDSTGHVLGKMDFSNIEKVLPCFTPGTRIATDRGCVAVGDLMPGDLVETLDNGLQELRWVGKRTLSLADLIVQPRLRPVRIAAGALGAGLPERDMMVSPQHRMLVEGARAEMLFGEAQVLVAATHLTSLPDVEPAFPYGITYLHLLFDQHELIRADGTWTESFQPACRTLDDMDADQRSEIEMLFPELTGGAASFPAARPTLKAHEVRVLLAD